ncbi:MAG: hypothetical protein ABIJ97_00120 [Bacteroidota bacterium]
MYNNTGNEYAYIGMEIPISSANINGTGLMLCERVKYTAVTEIVSISTANSNLDGSGTITDLITGGGSGVLVKRLTVKAQGNTSQGMVRIFHKDSSTTRLLREVEIPAITQSAEDRTLIAVIDELFYLRSSYKLRVSTENAETFIISAEGAQMSYPI